jgi:hypothetical protein
MSSIDQFESVFRSAVKTQYQPRSYPIRDILLLTDLSADEDRTFLTQVSCLFEGIIPLPKITLLPKEKSSDLSVLLESIKQVNPDLICTYRNLHGQTANFPYILGDHIEVLTQVTNIPILLLPTYQQLSLPIKPIHKIMAITDQLFNKPELIDAALHIIQHPGSLILAHVEDDRQFDIYMQRIAKIPEINTDLAKDKLTEQIFKEAQEYIDSCQTAIAKQHHDIQVYAEIQMGHHLQTYVALVAQHQVDLLVMNTKDQEQLAMHGLSYPLAIELSHLPLLML